MWAEGATRVGTLRVRDSGEQPAALRLAVSSQLSAADLRPPSAPPSSVLIVRRMVDPLPGRLRRRPGTARPDSAWERAVQQRLDDLYRSATRPADGPVADDANAVVFRDPAELLACLARDLCDGRAGRYWWHRMLLRDAVEWGTGALTALFVEHARSLPAALTRLNEQADAARVVAALSPTQATQVLAAVVAAHGLDTALLPVAGDNPPAHTTTARRGPGPWRFGWNSRPAPGPAAENEALLGLALLLHQAPAQVRSAAFRSAMRRWWAGEPAPAMNTNRPRAARSRTVEPAAENPSTTVQQTAERPDPASHATSKPQERHAFPRVAEAEPLPEDSFEANTIAPHSATPDRRPSARDAQSPTPALTGHPPTAPETATTASSKAPERPLAEAKDRASIPTPSSAAVEPVATPPSPGSEPVASPRPLAPRAFDRAVVAAEALETGIDTRLGGVLYLINLLLHLELPGCPESAWDLATRAGPWATLEALARGLLGAEIEDYAGDPLWTALAQLDGRPPEEPPADLDSRLSSALPDIRHRLALALGLSRPDLVTELLAVPGRLYVTRTHVDLVVALDHMSVRVRRAGLDRDPGWVPELGRVVLFHFE